jgi:hypothetical protein
VVQTFSGAEAAAGALAITLDGPRQSALITYRRLAGN